MSRALDSAVVSPFVRNSIVRSSERSSEAKDDGVAGVPPRAALSTDPSGLGRLFHLLFRDDPEDRHQTEPFDLAGVEEAIVEEEAARRGEDDAGEERGDKARDDDGPVG